LQGSLRKYCIDDAGHEVNLQFATEDWWISDLASFTEQRPSALFIQAMEASEVLLIEHDHKELLFQKIPALERMFRLMMQRSYAVLQERFLSILTNPAEERYVSFLEKYPALPQRIPQHHIASYLGMTPEFLSKVRKRLSAKKN
jgi:CRP-like cAMP-binding protein